jgi:hypothetical protein
MYIDDEAFKFLISLIPNWVKDDVSRGFFPSYYGTGSFEGDEKVHNRYMEIINGLEKTQK